jgi:hypothetical protein
MDEAIWPAGPGCLCLLKKPKERRMSGASMQECLLPATSCLLVEGPPKLTNLELEQNKPELIGIAHHQVKA